MKHIPMFRKIMNHIKTVGKVDPYQVSDYTETGCPVCLIGNAIRAGIMKKDFVYKNDLAFSDGFSKYFDVPKSDSWNLLYLDGSIGNDRNYQGLDYYKACKKFLARFGESK